jgi:hypothetical protein
MAKTKSTRGRQTRAAKKGRSGAKPKSAARGKKKSAKPAAKKRRVAKPKARGSRGTASTVTSTVWPGLPPGYFDRAR